MLLLSLLLLLVISSFELIHNSTCFNDLNPPPPTNGSDETLSKIIQAACGSYGPSCEEWFKKNLGMFPVTTNGYHVRETNLDSNFFSSPPLKGMRDVPLPLSGPRPIDDFTRQKNNVIPFDSMAQQRAELSFLQEEIKCQQIFKRTNQDFLKFLKQCEKEVEGAITDEMRKLNEKKAKKEELERELIGMKDNRRELQLSSNSLSKMTKNTDDSLKELEDLEVDMNKRLKEMKKRLENLTNEYEADANQFSHYPPVTEQSPYLYRSPLGGQGPPSIQGPAVPPAVPPIQGFPWAPPMPPFLYPGKPAPLPPRVKKSAPSQSDLAIVSRGKGCYLNGPQAGVQVDYMVLSNVSQPGLRNMIWNPYT